MPWSIRCRPGLAPDLPRGLDGKDAPAIMVRTPEQAREAVQRLVARRPDVIKLRFAPKSGMDLETEFQWVHAAIEEAHVQGLRVAAHATQREIARRMVAAGTDILVHSVDDRPVDPDLLAQMRANHVFYIPTPGVAPRYAEVLGQRLRRSPYERSLGNPAAFASLDDLARLFPGRRRGSRLPDNRTARENLLRVHEAGITIAAGRLSELISAMAAVLSHSHLGNA